MLYEVITSKTKKHTIKVVIDRVVIKEENSDRIAQDVEKALKESYGEVEIELMGMEDGEAVGHVIHYSEHNACFDCKVSFDRITSYNVCYTKLLRTKRVAAWDLMEVFSGH